MASTALSEEQRRSREPACADAVGPGCAPSAQFSRVRRLNTLENRGGRLHGGGGSQERTVLRPITGNISGKPTRKWRQCLDKNSFNVVLCLASRTKATRDRGAT